ncbi:MAG TPA: FxLYD domain-containing protein [Roseiflexaceae bacterium]|nr:FxLYD domain-containing protein [Roseiflexaceae bacterium]
MRSRPADFEARVAVREVRVDDLQVGRREYSSSVVLRGSVHNEAARDAQYAEVVVVFYDADGMVVGVGSTYADDGEGDRIAPGGAAPFRLDFVSFSGEPAAFYIYAEARNYD